MKLKKYPTKEGNLSNLKSNAQYQAIRTGMEDMDGIAESKYSPKKVRIAIDSVIKKLKKSKPVENFGDKWINRLKKDFGYNPYGDNDDRQIAKMIDDFENWCMNYEGTNESVNEGKGFVVFYKVKKDKDNRSVAPTQVAYSKENDAKKFLQSIEKDGGNGMIVPSNVHGLKEANEEPQVIQDLRWIVKNKQNKKVKDPVSGKQMRVDLFSASAVTQVYDNINDTNKKKYVTASLPKMVSMAFKLMK